MADHGVGQSSEDPVWWILAQLEGVLCITAQGWVVNTWLDNVHGWFFEDSIPEPTETLLENDQCSTCQSEIVLTF